MMQFRPLRVTDALDFAAENHGDTLVVSRVENGRRVAHTYREIHTRARQMAASLSRLGIGRGDRVATLAWNHHRHLELYFAVPGLGAVLHTINPRLQSEQIARIIELADDGALLFDSDLGVIVEKIRSRLPQKLRLIELSSGEPTVSGASAYEDLLSNEAADFDWMPGDETEACGLCFTSGTTGEPKGVLYTHRSTVLHAMACCMSEGQAISSRENILPVVPMFHANAWGIPHAAPMAGARLTLPGRFLDGQSLSDLIKAEGVSFLCGVPTVWQGLLEIAANAGVSWPTLKRAGIGGSAPTLAMIEQLEHAGISVFHAWGMTETNPFGGTGFLKPKHEAGEDSVRRRYKQMQGRAVFGLQRRLRNDDGASVAHDGKSAGRLFVRGNWVVGDYLNAKAPVDENGWFDTSDIATIDSDGYMRIVDRAKDLIKSGGEWISSAELEEIACSVPGVAQAAALGRPDPKWGERPIVVLRLALGATLDKAALDAAFLSHCAKWQIPDEIIVRTELPLTATGKIDKKALRVSLFEAPPAQEAAEP